jgi:Domain of unknown function (DUF4136)
MQAMRAKRSLGLGIIGALLLGFGSARAQKVETQYDRNADFSSFKTYAWRQERLLTQLSKENQAAVKHSLVNAVNAQLQAKGFTQTQSTPSFYVGYSGGSMAKGMAGEGMTAEELAHPMTLDAWDATMMPSEVPNVWVTMQGTLEFDVIDAKSNAVVWSSILREKLKNNPGQLPKDLDRETAELAQKAFRNFPPKTEHK